jgi:hypothetical protein
MKTLFGPNGEAIVYTNTIETDAESEEREV